MKLQQVRDHLRDNDMAGWLLYDFRGQNPIAASVAGLENTGTRRWFLWIPAEGEPQWLVHAIEQALFSAVGPDLAGPLHLYVSWQEMEDKLRQFLPQGDSKTIAMEYSPRCAIPYVSKVDAGTLEIVRAASPATVVSSADLVQLVQAVLTSEQIESHRRAAAHMLAAKDDAFAFVDAALRADQETTEYAVQQLIVDRFPRCRSGMGPRPNRGRQRQRGPAPLRPQRTAAQPGPPRRRPLDRPVGQGEEPPRRLLRRHHLDRLLRPSGAPDRGARLRRGRIRARHGNRRHPTVTRWRSGRPMATKSTPPPGA